MTVGEVYWHQVSYADMVCTHNHIACYACNQRRCIIRNVTTAPICNQFSVVPPGSRIREVGLFWD